MQHTTTQWANIGEDAGATYALIQRVTEVVPVAGIDCLWIFPPRRVPAGDSTVVVVGAFDEEARRRIITARFTVARNRKGAATVNVRFDEHGAAPVVAIPRIVQGVLRRLGEETAAEPRFVHVDGQQERWDALVIDLGGRPTAADDPDQAAADDPAQPAQPAQPEPPQPAGPAAGDAPPF